MDKEKMNDAKLICDRFLSDARKYLLAADAMPGDSQPATRRNKDSRCRSSSESPCGKNRG